MRFHVKIPFHKVILAIELQNTDENTTFVTNSKNNNSIEGLLE